MPKAYKRRSRRSTIHKRLIHFYYASELSLLQVLIIMLLLGLLVTGLLFSVHTFIATTFSRIFPSSYSVVGSPTISVTQIEHVLSYYHSPAQGKGQALYDDGEKYNIDPAYALAFFMHESTFGTRGIATTTHSLGNIRATAGLPAYHGYRYYQSWEAGFEDWYQLIAGQYVSEWGLSTVDQIIPVYAPATDNNDEARYISSVKQAVDTWRTGGITVWQGMGLPHPFGTRRDGASPSPADQT